MYGWILVKRNEKGPALEAKLLPDYMEHYNIYIFQLPFRVSDLTECVQRETGFWLTPISLGGLH